MISNQTRIGPYILSEVIGRGSFSIVRLAVNEINNKTYSCKIIQKSSIKNPNHYKRFQLEIRTNQQIHHPGIVKILDVLADSNSYFIIMEYCSKGNLLSYVVKKKRLKEDEARIFSYQLLSTLQFIHSQGICHRDLKPENILIDENNDIRISDFGLSNFVDKNGFTSTPVGSPFYASPECLSGFRYNGCKSDIWSCGVIMFAMLTGKMPWKSRIISQVIGQIRRGQYEIPTYLSKECRQLIKGLMTVNLSKRLTIPEALQMSWFQGKELREIPIRISQDLSLRRVDRFFYSEEGEISWKKPQIREFSSEHIIFDAVIKQIANKATNIKFSHRKNLSNNA